jgi:predicted nuclease with TOPRIM domain
MNDTMTFDDFMQRLLSLKEKLLLMPEELTLTEAFQEEQDKLSGLLDDLLTFSADEQAIAREQMRIFAEQLNEKLLQLQDRYETLRKNMDDSQLRLKGVKAYAKGRMT